MQRVPKANIAYTTDDTSRDNCVAQWRWCTLRSFGWCISTTADDMALISFTSPYRSPPFWCVSFCFATEYIDWTHVLQKLFWHCGVNVIGLVPVKCCWKDIQTKLHLNSKSNVTYSSETKQGKTGPARFTVDGFNYITMVYFFAKQPEEISRLKIRQSDCSKNNWPVYWLHHSIYTAFHQRC